MSYLRRWRRNHRMAETIARAGSSDDSGTEEHNHINHRDAPPNSDLLSRDRNSVDVTESSDVKDEFYHITEDERKKPEEEINDELYHITEEERKEFEEEINQFYYLTKDERKKLEENIASWTPENNVTMTTAEFQKMVLYLLADINKKLKDMKNALSRISSGSGLPISDITPQRFMCLKHVNELKVTDVMCLKHVNELKDLVKSDDFASASPEHELSMTTEEFQITILYSLIEMRQELTNKEKEFYNVCQELTDVKTACYQMPPGSGLTHINMPQRVTNLNEPKETLKHTDHLQKRLEPCRRSGRKRHRSDC